MTNTYFKTKNPNNFDETMFQAKMASVIHQMTTFVVTEAPNTYKILNESECNIRKMIIIGRFINGEFTNGFTLLQNALDAEVA